VASVAERNGFAATLRGTGAIGILAAFIIVGANLVIAPLGAVLVLIWVSIVVGAIGEELDYRGFLLERLGRIVGYSRSAIVAIVLLTTAFFAAVHIPEQGPYGAMQAAFTGLAFATIYAVTRSLWLPMVMHAAYDVAAVVIYLPWCRGAGRSRHPSLGCLLREGGIEPRRHDHICQIIDAPMLHTEAELRIMDARARPRRAAF
jgi:membrane protease YdiL (CAAX protease family)